jgi:hypothetical protein
MENWTVASGDEYKCVVDIVRGVNVLLHSHFA